jgi:hypothetical protein
MVLPGFRRGERGQPGPSREQPSGHEPEATTCPGVKSRTVHGPSTKVEPAATAQRLATWLRLLAMADLFVAAGRSAHASVHAPCSPVLRQTAPSQQSLLSVQGSPGATQQCNAADQLTFEQRRSPQQLEVNSQLP